MRDLTEKELSHLYSNKGCLFCGSGEFFPGPCGGAMQNIECAGCGAKYNVAEPHLGIQVGQLLHGPTSTNYTPIPKETWLSWLDRLFKRFRRAA